MEYIGIIGKKGVGKTSLAKAMTWNITMIQESARVAFVNFADPLKKEVSEKFRISFVDLYEDKNKTVYHPELPRKDMTIRQVMQWYGQTKRAEDKFYWIKALERELALINPSIAIVGDVRFPNESEWLSNKLAFQIYLAPYDGWNELDTDESESYEMFDFDFDYFVRPPFGHIKLIAPTVVQDWIRFSYTGNPNHGSARFLYEYAMEKAKEAEVA